MDDNKIVLRDMFIKWLSDKVSANVLSEYYFAYNAVDDFCSKVRVLNKSLFEIDGKYEVGLVKNVINNNPEFHYANRKKIKIIRDAMNYFFKYLDENVAERKKVILFNAIKKEKETVERTNEDTNILFKTENLVNTEETIETKEKNNKDEIINFDTIKKYEYAKPEWIKILGTKVYVESWIEVYIILLRTVYKMYPRLIERMKNRNIMGNGSIDIADNEYAKKLRRAKRIDDNFYIESNLSTSQILQKVRAIIKLADLKYKDVEIKYTRKELNKTNVQLINKEKSSNIKDSTLDGNGGYLQKDKVEIEQTLLSEITDHIDEKTNIEAKNDFSSVSVLQKETEIDGEFVNFDAIKDYEYTKPEWINIFDQKTYVTSWKNVYIIAMKAMYEKNPNGIEKMKNKILFGRNIALADADHVKFLRNAELIGNDLYLEINLSTTNILKRIQHAIKIAGFRQEDIQIKYHRSSKIHQSDKSTRKSQMIYGYSHPMVEIDEEEKRLYEKVISEKFPNGIDITSVHVSLRRFIIFYNNEAEHELDYRDTEVVQDVKTKIENVCVMQEKIAYAVSSLLSEETAKKMDKYISNAMETNGILYYKTIMDDFDGKLGRIYDIEKLKAYLLHVYSGKYILERNYMKSSIDVQIDFNKEIRDELINLGRPAKPEEISVRLKNIPLSKIKDIMSSDKNIIPNEKGSYFDISFIELNETELNDIKNMLTVEIKKYDYIGMTEAIKIVKNVIPDINERFPYVTNRGLKYVLRYYMGSRFSFKNNVISLYSNIYDMKRIYEEITLNDTFTIEQIKNLKKELDTDIDFEALYENSVRISVSQFVNSRNVNFDIDAVDEAIAGFCTGSYIPLSGIKNFGLFPAGKYSWNTFLLEQYVYKYSRKFKLINNGFNMNKSLGAIVRRNSGIDTFEDLIVTVLADQKFEMNIVNATLYLKNNDYISNNSMKNMEQIVQKVIARKGR